MTVGHGCVVGRWVVAVASLGFLATSAWAQTLGGVASSSVPVYVEDSLEAAESVETARAMLAEGKVTEAVARLEAARRGAAGRLLAVEPGRYRDAGLAIDALIASDPRLMSAYEATQSPAAERLWGQLAPNDLAGMLDLMNRAYLTRSGYEAGLSAVGLLLERAEAGEALRLLDRLEAHPLAGSDGVPGRRASLRAAASRLAGEAWASAGPGDELVSRLPRGAASDDAWRSGGGAAEVFSAEDWSRRLAAGRVRALWRWEIERSATPAVRAGRSSDQSERALAKPALAGDRVLLNVGDAVVGLDRYSGREVWRLSESTDEDTAEALGALRGRLFEPRGVWAERGWGCAVLGTGGLIRQGGRGNVATASSEVVAFDTDDGSLRWRTPIESMGEPAEGAVLVGTPIVLRDRVVVLLRRSRVTGFQDTIAVGLARADGSVAWVRHISSTATSARFTDWPTPSAIERRGLLYVTDRLGAAAAIEAATGRVVWLTILAEASERARRGVDLRSTALQNGPGVIPTAAGLIVAVASHPSGMAVLDPTDGQRLIEDWRAIDEEVRGLIRGARALLPLDGDLLAVGGTTGRIDGASLEVVWERSGVLSSTLRGEPIVSGGVLIASGESLIGLDVATGRTVFETATSVSGHVAAGGSLVVVAGSDAVEGLLDWGLVSERLVARLERPEASDSAEPGLALAFAAWRAGDGELLLRGVDHALLAAGGDGGGEPESAGVFETVLPLAQEPSIDASVRSAVFDRLASVTATAAQEVALRFARGGALADEGRVADALEQYQAVLIDPVLREQLYEGATLDRLASLESRARIERLLADHGRALYEPYDTAAERRLIALQASDRAEAGDLLDLVSAYPLADCGLEALVEAGRLEMSAERWGEAVRVLRRAYARLPDDALPGQSGEVLGRLVEAYVADGRPGSAAAWLHRSQRERPGLLLWAAGGQATAEQRLAELAERAGSAARPLLKDRRVVAAESIEGRLLGAAAGAGAESMSSGDGVVLVERAGRLIGLSPATGEPLWQTTFEAPGAVLLSRDDDAAMVWWPQGSRVFGLDLKTGQESWPSVAATTELDRVATVDEEEMTDAQRRFVRELGPNAAAVAQLRARIARVGGRLVVRAEEPQFAGQLAAGGLETTVVADRRGRMLGMDGLSGEVIWRLRTPLRSVGGLTADHGLVAVRGVMFPGEDHQTDAVVVLDAASGQTRLGPLEFHEPVLATALTADGGLIVVGREEVSHRSVADGALRWRTQLPDDGALLDVQVGSESLMMALRRAADATVAVIGLDLESGTQLPGPALIASRSPIAPQLLASDDAWLLAGPTRLLGLYDTGQMRWADGATLPDGAGVLAAWLGRERAVVAYTLPDRGGDADDEHRVLTYELDTGRIVDDTSVRFAPVEAPAMVTVTRPQALYLGSGARTVRLILE